MSSTAIIIFREILEIAMILSVVLVATRGLPGRGIWIGLGFAGGIAGAGLVALFAEAIGAAAAGMGQELFNAFILFTAASMIGWTAIWMRSHSRELTTQLRQTGQAVIEGKLPGFSLSLIIGLAILREGSEIVLFIYSMIAAGQPISSIVTGSLAGVAAGIVAGALLYFGLIKLSARYMLKVTGWLLILLVAGLSAQGARSLSAAGYFSSLSMPLWSTSWLLSEGHGIGRALHSLIGYSERPTAIELLFYAVTLFSLLLIIAFNDRHRSNLTPAAA